MPTTDMPISINSSEYRALVHLLSDLATGPGYVRREGSDTAQRVLDSIIAGTPEALRVAR